MASDIGPGTLVECVEGDFRPVREHAPKLRGVYTVREVLPETYVDPPHVTIRLREIVNRPQRYREGFRECSFDINAFRPVNDDSLDVFRQAIKDAPVDDKVTA